MHFIEEDKNKLADEKFCLDEQIQKQQDQIDEQEIVNRKMNDEIELRKVV